MRAAPFDVLLVLHIDLDASLITALMMRMILWKFRKVVKVDVDDLVGRS